MTDGVRLSVYFTTVKPRSTSRLTQQPGSTAITSLAYIADLLLYQANCNDTIVYVQSYTSIHTNAP